ncbi:MAG TPA: hypothetical protein PKH02_01630 [Bacteroidales bacterium]|nr:hypothetical protein [Bacteroidales bacterium]HPT71755.1 hypothetical protein [Candidatus Cloacimonadota bacterium]
MKDSLKQIALHESGHALAHILVGLPFSVVTIEPKLDGQSKSQSLGYIQPLTPYFDDSTSYSGLSSDEFLHSFSIDVTVIAGFISQRVFAKEFDKTGSKTDFKILNSNRLMNQPEPFRTAYKRFLIAYTFQLLSMNVHKQMIMKIADELLKKKTLNYDEVKKIVDQYVGTE